LCATERVPGAVAVFEALRNKALAGAAACVVLFIHLGLSKYYRSTTPSQVVEKRWRSDVYFFGTLLFFFWSVSFTRDRFWKLATYI